MWSPVSVKALHLQVLATQTLMLSQSATAARTASSVSRRPDVETVKTKSQSLLCGETAAKNLAF